MFSPWILIFFLFLLRVNARQRVPGLGSVTILNNSSDTLYMQVVAGLKMYPIVQLNTYQSFSERYLLLTGRKGVSCKIALDRGSLASGVNEIQFEYSCINGECWYDLSAINDKSGIFSNKTYSVTPSDPQCDTRLCCRGDRYCPEVYHNPTDNQVVRACSWLANLTVAFSD